MPWNRKQWSRFLPFLSWRGAYARQEVRLVTGLRGDLQAGVLGCLVLIPQALLFGTLIGLPLIYGFYAALVPVLIAALWSRGGAPVPAFGPTAVVSYLMFATVAPLVTSTTSVFALAGTLPEVVRLTLALTFLIGVLQLLLAGLRLANVARYVTPPLILGFTTGIALLIIAAQVGTVFGITLERNLGVWKTITGFFRQFSNINVLTLAAVATTIVVCASLRRWLPRWPVLAAGLVLGSLFAYGLNQYYGMPRTGLRTLEGLTFTWPPFAKVEWSWKMFGQLLPLAVVAALLLLAQGSHVAAALAPAGTRRGADRDGAVAQGLANVIGSLFSGFAGGSSLPRSRIEQAAGARTPATGLIAVLLLFPAVWFGARYLVHVPVAVVAALLVVVAWDLIDVRRLVAVWNSGRDAAAVLLVTFFATQWVALEQAFLIGLVCSLILQVRRGAQPVLADVKPAIGPAPVQFVTRADVADCPQLKILRFAGAIDVASLDAVQAALDAHDAAHPEQRHVLLVASGLLHLDDDGARWLGAEAVRRRAAGGGLYLHEVPEAARQLLEASGALAQIGADGVFAAGSDPVTAIFPRLNGFTCAACERRIFEVCPKPVEVTWQRPPGDKTRGRYAVPPTAWARPRQPA